MCLVQNKTKVAPPITSGPYGLVYFLDCIEVHHFLGGIEIECLHVRFHWSAWDQTSSTGVWRPGTWVCMQTALQTWTCLVAMFNVTTCCMLQCVCEKQARWLLCSSSLPHTSCCILAYQTARRCTCNRVTWNWWVWCKHTRGTWTKEQVESLWLDCDVHASLIASDQQQAILRLVHSLDHRSKRRFLKQAALLIMLCCYYFMPPKMAEQIYHVNFEKDSKRLRVQPAENNPISSCDLNLNTSLSLLSQSD